MRFTNFVQKLPEEAQGGPRFARRQPPARFCSHVGGKRGGVGQLLAQGVAGRVEERPAAEGRLDEKLGDAERSGLGQKIRVVDDGRGIVALRPAGLENVQGLKDAPTYRRPDAEFIHDAAGDRRGRLLFGFVILMIGPAGELSRVMEERAQDGGRNIDFFRRGQPVGQ